jgi:hypothetical protein
LLFDEPLDLMARLAALAPAADAPDPLSRRVRAAQCIACSRDAGKACGGARLDGKAARPAVPRHVAMRWAQRLKRALRRKMAGAPRPVLVTQVWRGIHQHLAAAPWHSIVFAASGLVVASRERRDGRVHQYRGRNSGFIVVRCERIWRRKIHTNLVVNLHKCHEQ